MGNIALWFVGIMLGIIVVHLIHIKMYLRGIHIGLEATYDRMGEVACELAKARVSCRDTEPD